MTAKTSLPAQPLRERYASRLEQLKRDLENDGYGALRRLAEQVHTYYPELDIKRVEEKVIRLLKPKAQSVSMDTADRMAYALGLHPRQIWPEEW